MSETLVLWRKRLFLCLEKMMMFVVHDLIIHLICMVVLVWLAAQANKAHLF